MKKAALAWLIAALFFGILGGCMGIDSLILRLFRRL